MNIKKYQAQDVPTAMEMVRDELGRDAVILQTRQVRKKGIFGFFSKPLVEIVAVYEKKGRQKSGPSVAKPASGSAEKYGNDRSAVSAKFTKPDLTAGHIANAAKPVEDMVVSPLSLQEFVNDGAKGAAVAAMRGETHGGIMDAEYRRTYERLRMSDIEPEICDEIIRDAKVHKGLRADDAVASVLRKRLKLESPIAEKKGNIILLLGPTGVGKTTTLAKLAARYSLELKRDVGILTADTYRIAAIDQLKTYAEILDVPIDVLYSAADFAEIQMNLSEKDIVFIDTAGKSPNDEGLRAEINDLVKACSPDEIYLVISSTINFSAAMNILERYSFVDNLKLIFSKLDESIRPGMIVNCLWRSPRPVGYITTGQNVPDDISEFNSVDLVNSVMGRKV